MGYKNQAFQTGYGLPGFQGIPYQRGYGLGSFFRGLFRMAMPVLKTVGKTVGKQALATGSNFLGDVVQGRNWKESLEEHGRAGASNLLKQAGEALQQKGGRLGKRKASGKTPSIPKKRQKLIKGKRKPKKKPVKRRQSRKKAGRKSAKDVFINV